LLFRRFGFGGVGRGGGGLECSVVVGFGVVGVGAGIGVAEAWFDGLVMDFRAYSFSDQDSRACGNALPCLVLMEYL
jgi:hypothetical protein